MLFLPPGVRVKRTYHYTLLTVAPMKVLDYDTSRLVAIIVSDNNRATYPVFAGNANEIMSTALNSVATQAGEIFYGPEALWAAVGNSGLDGQAAIWIQQLFVA